jgi:superoxide dismutase, Fe-Mn family
MLHLLINGLKREELVAANSMILHELFVDDLGDQSEPGPAVRDQIIRDFGSFERWRQELTAMGKALGGGWVFLSWSRHGRRALGERRQAARRVSSRQRAMRGSMIPKLEVP